MIFGCKTNNAMLRNKTPGTKGPRVQSRWFGYLGFFSSLKRRRYFDFWRQRPRISAFCSGTKKRLNIDDLDEAPKETNFKNTYLKALNIDFYL